MRSVLLTLVLLPTVSTGATLEVKSGEYDSIQSALTFANDGDTIEVTDEGTQYVETLYMVQGRRRRHLWRRIRHPDRLCTAGHLCHR